MKHIKYNMMRHLNKKIGMFGQDLVCKYLKENKINYWVNNDQNNYNKNDIIMEIDNKLYFVEVSTKRHTFKNGHKCTGKNTKQIDRYVEREKKYGLKYFIVFVDYNTKSIYGNYVSNLMNKTYSNGKEFPFYENAGGQKITYFNLKNMDKLTDINYQDLDKLGELHFKNKNNKFQVDIFDAIKNV
tara:strand:- start:711 stop:1265 length:555 start_codon:yes stop_codon:yes gene_type:complete